MARFLRDGRSWSDRRNYQDRRLNLQDISHIEALGVLRRFRTLDVAPCDLARIVALRVREQHEGPMRRVVLCCPYAVCLDTEQVKIMQVPRVDRTDVEGMFTLPINLLFAEAETKSELREAFDELAAVVPSSSPDVDVATETLWAALHGLAQLEHWGRIKRGTRLERAELLVDGLFR